MIEVPLTQGRVALIDDEDAERVLAYKWHAWWCAKGGRWYAMRTVQVGKLRRCVRLHRFIVNAPDGVQVDHIDRDSLNNRRSNLRFATHGQNQTNKKRHRTNKTGFKGVYWHKAKRTFVAQVRCGGVTYSLVGFNTAQDAARARDMLAKRYHGEFATLNFPAD